MIEYDFSTNETMHFTPTGDSALDNLLHEVDIAIQDVRDFTLPYDMVVNEVYGACDFFHIPYPPIIDSEGTCVWPNDPCTQRDDVIGLDREQLMEMGVYGKDALGLVMTHECCHRMLQNYGYIDPWEHEGACDFFAGVRAGMGLMDTTHFENSLINSSGSETHPVGTLRVEMIEYGKQIAAEMNENGIQPTFENCLEKFNQYLSDNEDKIKELKNIV
jgi:hypothetical protein